MSTVLHAFSGNRARFVASKATIAFLFVSLFLAGCVPLAPPDYVGTTPTGGAIEAKYLAYGPSEVDFLEFDAPEPELKYSVFFPKELRDADDFETKYPVVVFVNGTGVKATSYPELFRHMASWGFVVIGNQDPSTGKGASTDRSLAFLLAENDREGSPFYGKLDAERVGALGHSQGGAGVFNAITSQEHSGLYKAAVALSPANERLSRRSFPYDVTRVKAPTLMVGGTVGSFETKFVMPLSEMTRMYDRMTAPKGMMRKKGYDHVRILCGADGYATAWLRAWLCDDAEAMSAFSGESPEALTNELYSDARFDLNDGRDARQ